MVTMEPVVDIHTHILPDADDGARSWEMAKEMCALAARDGITQMVATPHANDEFTYDRVRHQHALDKLQHEANIKLTLGCDFHLSFDNIRAAQKDPQQFTIGATKYLLVELSDFGAWVGVSEGIHELQQVGVVPVLTHPERNPVLQRNQDHILKLADAGCLIQVTASAFTGYWGEPVKKLAEWLLKKHAVHVVASDAHDTRKRPPVLSAARQRVTELAGERIAERVVNLNPAAIVAGHDVVHLS
jgi:protein-tyrosine phosphatase